MNINFSRACHEPNFVGERAEPETHEREPRFSILPRAELEPQTREPSGARA